MKKKYMLISGIALVILLVGCGKAEDSPESDALSTVPLESRYESGAMDGMSDEEEGQPGEEMPGGGAEGSSGGQTDIPEGQPDGETPAGSAQQATKEPDSGQLQPSGTEFGFAALSDRYFEFSSGAGGWSTDLRIDSDGKFKGSYHDSDMGDSGEDYPNGTMYHCSFKGQFGELEKVDDTTYKMKLVSLTIDEAPETEIADGIRWIASTANGLDGGEEFYLYLPGSVLADLPEEYRQWVGYFNLEDVSETTLPYYGLYNVNTGAGFSSYEYKEQSLSERIAMEISFAEASSAELEAKLQEDTTQADMNATSGELFQTWDNTLNIVWKLLESELDEEKMAALREEERQWIAEKETAVKEAGQQYEGGSMQSMEESLKAAELTEERVRELAGYAE